MHVQRPPHVVLSPEGVVDVRGKRVHLLLLLDPLARVVRQTEAHDLEVRVVGELVRHSTQQLPEFLRRAVFVPHGIPHDWGLLFLADRYLLLALQALGHELGIFGLFTSPSWHLVCKSERFFYEISAKMFKKPI
uniref:(northern house mosquito) hypothetical protein n=1 Tax=Culex pipiens TaxID=7175 RepID=A0A8D8PH93_CULPI